MNRVCNQHYESEEREHGVLAIIYHQWWRLVALPADEEWVALTSPIARPELQIFSLADQTIKADTALGF